MAAAPPDAGTAALVPSSGAAGFHTRHGRPEGRPAVVPP